MENIKNLLIQSDVRLEIKEYGIIIKNPTEEDAKAINEKTKNSIKLNNNEVDILIKDAEVIRFLFDKLVEGIDMNDFSDEELELITTKPSPLMKKIINEITNIFYDLIMQKIDDFTLKLKELKLMSKTNEIDKNMNKFSEETGIEIPKLKLNQIIEEPKESVEDKIIRLTEEMDNEKDIKKKRVILSELSKLYEEIDKQNE